MKTMIPYSKQSITAADKKAVMEALSSDWITQGPKILAFEKQLAKTCGAKYVVAVSSGTAALHLACLALGVSKGKEVVTSPNTFAASSNAVLYCGGKPKFCDIDAETFNLDSRLLAKKITKRTAGVIPVHFSGQPADMEAIWKLAKRKRLFVLEDASHALGAKYKVGSRTYKVGSCAHSDATVFSFHPVKGITTGEGGAIATNSHKLYKKLLSLRMHGLVRDAKEFKTPKLGGSWYYEMQDLGYNYRITDIQCALGLSQLKRLNTLVKKRRSIAKKYNQAFKTFPLIHLPVESRGNYSAQHLYVIRLANKKLVRNRSAVFDALRKEGVGVQVHYIPVHLQPYYKKLGFKKGDFPISESYYASAISIPVFPDMTDAMVKKVVRVVKKVVSKYAL